MAVSKTMVTAQRYISRPEPVIPYKMGQPTHETRPQIITKVGDLTPGISALEYYNRRLALVQQMPKHSVAIFPSNSVQYSSGSVFYDFQQDNNLYYMTGWMEPNSVAVVEKVADNGDDEDAVFHMLVPEKNPLVEIWEGERSGLQGCYDFFNVDGVENITKLKPYISDLIKRNQNVFFDDNSSQSLFSTFFGRTKDTKTDDIRSLITSMGGNKVVRRVSPLVTKLREVKSTNEVRVMKKAGQISSRAINKAIAKVGSDTPLQTEKLLAAFLHYEFVRTGCDKLAYIPVVAGGENALIIHYTRNDDVLYDGELTFIDAGGKLGGYCSDISRTWPNSSAFSEPQRDIYEAVLSTNKACIDQCFYDNHISLNDLHEYSVDKLHANLKNITGFQNVSRLDLTRYLYPHYIGHHLGLDLHDVPSTSKFVPLQSGNVVTVEPGLYIPKDSKWPRHFQGIGVRVEDDIVVGKSKKDIVNLTSACVKEVADIEALIRTGKCTTPGVYDEVVDIHIDE